MHQICPAYPECLHSLAKIHFHSLDRLKVFDSFEAFDVLQMTMQWNSKCEICRLLWICLRLSGVI